MVPSVCGYANKGRRLAVVDAEAGFIFELSARARYSGRSYHDDVELVISSGSHSRRRILKSYRRRFTGCSGKDDFEVWA